MKSTFLVATLCVAIASGACGQIIYSNGPLITHPGGAAGGNDGSALQNVAPVFLSLYGTSCNGAAGYRVADDFTVPCGEVWNVNSLRVFSYQTGSGTAATSLTGGNYRIWNAQPGTAGAAILFDFSAASQMTAVAFPSPFLYRATIGTIATDVNRPIQQLTMAGNGIVLPAGTYWLDWAVTGSLASGPWCPPITILGTAVTGNGIQYTGTWAAVTSGASPNPISAQGLPFEIDHSTTLVGCFTANVTQAGPGGLVTLTDSGGVPGLTAFNAITLNAGTFPNDWFFGIGIPLGELATLASSGPPFVLTIPPSGTVSFSTGYSLGFPITVYYVGLMLNGNQLHTADVAKSITLM